MKVSERNAILFRIDEARQPYSQKVMQNRIEQLCCDCERVLTELGDVLVENVELRTKLSNQKQHFGI